MANQTEIAQELSRIESAKGVLLDKALELELEYYDPDEGVASKRRVNDGDALNTLADAFDQMPHYPSPIPGELEGNGNVTDGAPNTDGVLIYGQKVHINDGYYTGNQVASVQSGSVGKPVISVDPSNGKITATAAMTAGYIPDGTASNESVVQHTNLTAANIKDGTTIFGIEGTFTEDGTATAGVILEGNRAYVKGSPVDGTMPNHGAMGLIQFNPLEEDIHTCIGNGNGGYVQSLSVRVTNHLLNRLKAI